MIRALCWKEYREHRAIWLVIAGLTALLVVGLGAALAPTGLATLRQDEGLRRSLAFVVVSMAVAYGVVCGSLMLAGEREAGTLDFLEVLAVRRAPVWTGKVLIGAALTLAQALLLAVLAALAGVTAAQESPGVWFWWLPLLALDAYAWGLLGSALCRNVFAAAVLAAALLGGSWGVLALLTWLLPDAPLGPRFVMAVAVLAASGRVFCQPDWRRFAERRAGAVGMRWAPGWRALAWLAVRQGWVEAGVLLATGLVLGTMLPLVHPLVWLLGLAGVGVVCGTAAFAGEQSGGRHFLGAERLPPARVWAVKTVAWAVVAGLVTVAVFLGASVSFTVQNPSRTSTVETSVLGRLLGEMYFHGIGRYWLLAMLLLYGFSAGQLAMLVLRQRVVAMVAAAAVAAGLLTLWLPSLLLGGLPLWQMLGPPVLLLAAGRLMMWPWFTDRLMTRGPMAGLAGCGLLAVLWMAGALWHRAVEIPDVGEPFDRKAFEAGLPTPENNEAGALMQQACRELHDFGAGVSRKLGPPKQPLVPMAKGEPADEAGPGEAAEETPSRWYNAYLERAGQVVEKGWPSGAAELGRWLDQMFAGEWADQLRKAAAAPLGLVFDPRTGSLRTPRHHLDQGRPVATLFAARALQLQARGQEGAALEHLAVARGLARQMRHKTPLFHVLNAWSMEETALTGMDRWLAKLGPRPELLRRSLDELKRHEEETPPLADNVKAEYCVGRNDLSELFRLGSGVWEGLFALAREVPWEKERETRLFHALFVGELRRAEQPYWRQDEPATSREDTSRERAFQKSFWARFIATMNTFKMPVSEARHQCLVRAERLRIALALHQVEKGRAAARLADLVPRYLPELPLDPFSGRPFGYRVSRGERIATFNDRFEKGPPLDVRPGQGVLWSSGPDRKDDGGTKQGPLGWPRETERWSALGLDLVFLVPQWPKG